MDKVVEELNLNVIGQCSHQFEKDNFPLCVTMSYLLSESSIYSYFCRWRKNNHWLFTWSLGIENGNITSIVKDYFDVNILNIYAYYLHAKIKFLYMYNKKKWLKQIFSDYIIWWKLLIY